jgi:hypothetical protein
MDAAVLRFCVGGFFGFREDFAHFAPMAEIKRQAD